MDDLTRNKKSLKREWFEVGKGWIYSGVLCLLCSLGCYWLTNHSNPDFWLFNMWIFLVFGILFIPIGIARLYFFGTFRTGEGNKK